MSCALHRGGRRHPPGGVAATCIALLAASLTTGAATPAANATSTPASLPADPRVAVELYLRALMRGDAAAADAAWMPQDLAHAHRLDIRYATDLPKQDNASAVLDWIAALREGKCRLELERIDQHQPEDRAAVRARVVNAQPSAEMVYHLQRDDAGWRLASPLRHAAEGWTRREGRYIRLFASEATAADEFVVQALDGQVERFARVLQVEESVLARLQAHKLDWLLGNEAQVAAIVGTPTQGLANLQFDAVITQERFHAHELAHLMVGVWLRELPLYTLPLLQEGLAVHLGGRFGKSPAVEAMLGAFVLANHMTCLDSLLVAESFRIVPPDQAYAVAGVFCGFLIEKLGARGFADLYRALGGTREEVASLDRAAILTRLESATGSTWAALATEFAAWWPAHTDTGIGPGCNVSAGSAAAIGARELHVAGKDPAFDVRASVVDGRLRLVVKTSGDSPRGALLLATATRLPPTSRRFAEQLPDTAYRGQRMGIVFDAEEVGLYDFGLDLLVAKFARALGGAGELWEPSAATLCVEVATRLLPAGFDVDPWEFVAR